MRTVFVPFVLLPDASQQADREDEDEDAREMREAGEAERTVVLCVEVENSGEQGGMGFEVDGVNVSVSGEGAGATLIGWGEGEGMVFPLKIGPMEQYNLLYAVTFVRGPDDADVISLTGTGGGQPEKAVDLQRAVALTILGKPFVQPSLVDAGTSKEEKRLSYPTKPFSSRWNCILDLSPQQDRDAPLLDDPWGGQRDVLPEPASPFPTTTPRTAMAFTVPSIDQLSALHSPNVAAMAGTMRNTVSENFIAARTRRRQSQTPRMSMIPSLASPATSGIGTPKINILSPTQPPSALPHFITSPTTYAPPSAQWLGSAGIDPNAYDQFAYPPTPAYPAYPSNSSSPAIASPQFQIPISSQQSGSVGPSVEIRRAKAATGALPQTPGPTVGTIFPNGRHNLSRLDTSNVNADAEETIIVSVGLVGNMGGQVRPCEKFTLDVFVFNKSSWTRRFELSYPERKRRRRDSAGRMKSGSSIHDQGVLPMENRIRVG